MKRGFLALLKRIPITICLLVIICVLSLAYRNPESLWAIVLIAPLGLLADWLTCLFRTMHKTNELYSKGFKKKKN